MFILLIVMVTFKYQLVEVAQLRGLWRADDNRHRVSGS